METLVGPLERTDLSEQIYRALRDSIIKRHLKPGEKITADEMADKFKVSRTPVTSALQRLATEGLVEIIPQRGTFITELTPRDVAELFDIRLMIELYAAEQILKSARVPQFLGKVKEAMERMGQAMGDDDYRDYEGFIDGDRDLHLALVTITDNQRLTRLYEDLHVHIQVARAHYIDSVERARQAYREHEAIVQAFRDQNPEMVRAALCQHIETVKARILDILNQPGAKL